MERLKEKLRDFPYWFYVIRGVAVFFLLIAIKSVMGLSIMNIYSDMDINVGGGAMEMPFFAVAIMYFVGTLFLLNSLLHIFTTYDKRVMNAYLAEGIDKPLLSVSFKRSLTSLEYWVETAPILFFTLLGALIGWFPEISYSFEATGAPDALLFWLPVIFMLPITFFLTLWRRYEAQRYWSHLERSDSIGKLYRMSRLLLRAILIPSLYMVFFPYTPMVAVVFLSLSGFLMMLVDLLSLLGFIAAVAVLIALILGICALRSIGKRKKLIKSLNEVCRSSGYTLSEIKRPYASLFVRKKECNFTVEKDGKKFSCHFLGSFWQRAPMYFASDKYVYYRHRIGTQNHHVVVLSTFEFDFEGEGDKIILLNPVPKRAFVSNDEMLIGNHTYMPDDSGRLSSILRRSRKEAKSTRELVPGDRIWGYAIYNTTSFINAIDRKCLGRYNGMFD